MMIIYIAPVKLGILSMKDAIEGDDQKGKNCMIIFMA